MNAAKQGKEIAEISKLEQRFPTIYKNGKLWKWLDENDIHCSGSADHDGKMQVIHFGGNKYSLFKKRKDKL